MLRILIIVFLFVVAGLVSLVVFAGGVISSPEDIQIVKVEIGRKTYYVPKLYFELKSNSLSGDEIYVRAIYPEFASLMEDPIEFWKRTKGYGNIRIMARIIKSDISFNDFSLKGIDHLKAFDVVGEEYGLIHQTQPQDQVQDKDDIWLEKSGGRYISTIECSEHIMKTDVPQCTQRFFNHNRLLFRVHYDKKLLPHWKEIQNNVEALFKSFESENSAREFLYTRIKQKQIALPAQGEK